MSRNKDSSDDIKNYEPRLNQEWVQILINLRMKYSKLFTRKRNSASEAWKQILQEMVDLGAPSYITLDKIKKKWMNLIARFKHLKFTSNVETITWPYFEQIDRAYFRNPNIVEIRKSNSRKGSDSDESHVSDYTEFMMKKQKFTSMLIQLRYAYRHLFTGRKYAAQKGWMVVQNLLPNGQSYTITQISKRWQNLIQRYKILIENEKDHSKITWVHFKHMHEMMTRKEDVNEEGNVVTIKKEEVSTENSLDTIENENEDITRNDSASEIEGNLMIKSEPNVSKKRKRQPATTLGDLISYFKERDRKLDQYHQEIVGTLKGILKDINR